MKLPPRLVACYAVFVTLYCLYAQLAWTSSGPQEREVSPNSRSRVFQVAISSETYVQTALSKASGTQVRVEIKGLFGLTVLGAQTCVPVPSSMAR